jgi:NitT/TauT family transport system permease protein
LVHFWLRPSQSIYAMALAISLSVTSLVIYSGVEGVEVNQIKLARTSGASKAQILTKVILPGSFPMMIAALKVNVGLSQIGVVGGEFRSASVGLGYLIQDGSRIFRLDIVMTAVTVLAVVSFVDLWRHRLGRAAGHAAAIVCRRRHAFCANCVSRQSRLRDQQKAEPI